METNLPSICECDVEDKESLSLFRMKWAEWERCLIEDKYSVYNQILHLLWNDIVFRTFNEARRLSVETNSNNIGLNGPIIELLDEGYVASQIMAIRRLSDPNFYDPKKAVISLRRIIDDIGNNLDLFTRENYICYDGTRFEDLSHDENGINWIHWNRKHKNFDRLSGVNDEERSRGDKIKKEFISYMVSILKSCDGFREYANKFLAHTSDQIGRRRITDRQIQITFEKLDAAYKAMIKCSSFLGVVLLYQYPLGGIPVPQFNQFKNLDKQIISTKDISVLESFWITREKEVRLWDDDIWPQT